MENQNQNQNDEPDQLVLMKAANLSEVNKNLLSLINELRKLDNGSHFRAVVEALGRLSKELQLKMVDVENAAKTPPAAPPAPNVTVRAPEVRVDAPDISGIEKLLNKQLPALVQQLVDGLPEVPETDLTTLEDLLKELKTTMAQVRDRPIPVPQMPTTLKVTNPDGTTVASSTTSYIPVLKNGLTNAASGVVSSAPAVLASYFIYNPNAAVTYIQFFDVPTAAVVTVGTTTPRWSIGIPPTSAANLSPNLSFVNGIQVAATTTATGAGAPVTAVDANFSYR